MIAGTQHPESLIRQSMIVFLACSRATSTQNALLRTNLTREGLIVEGFNTDVIEGQGDTRLAQQWTCLHFGDYVAFYLAMAYGVDPTPAPSLEVLRERMKALSN